MKVNTGCSLFLDISNQIIFLKNFEGDNKRNCVKGSVRLVVAYIALGIFCKIGFYFNLAMGIGKVILGVLTIKKNSRLFGKKSKQVLSEAYIHLKKAIIDLIITTFKQLATIIYVISPDTLDKLLKTNLIK